MKKLIVVADWANDSLTRQEFRTSVEGFLKVAERSRVNFVSSTPSTIHTGFLVNQIVETEERYGQPLETLIFQNTDPRLQSIEGETRAKGAEFIILKLLSGLFVCGPNAGFDFSFIKNKIDKVFLYKNLDQGTQFRSRDLYSRVCAHLMDEMEDELEIEETHSNIIPVITSFFVVHIDNFGNLKTNIPLEFFKGKYEFGDELEVEINRVKKKIRFVESLFAGKLGDPVIYPGSSGSKDNPFLEISIWRHFTEDNQKTGKELFENPRPGTAIKVI